MRRHTLLLVFLVIVLAIVGCGETGPSGSDRTEPSAPATTVTPTTGSQSVDVPKELVGTWRVTHFITIAGPQPVPAQAQAQLTFEAGGGVNVETGCNAGSGTVTLDEGTITISDLAMTEVACVNQDLASLEQTIVEVVSHPLSWSVTEGSLSLTPTDMSDSGLQLEDATG